MPGYCCKCATKGSSGVVLPGDITVTKCGLKIDDDLSFV